MPLHIGLLTFPRVQQLDLTGPYEVFATLPDTQLHLIWKTLTPITSATGLILTPRGIALETLRTSLTPHKSFIGL